MPTCCWICTHRLCALIRALALGLSGTLIASTPSRESSRAPSISFEQSIPFGETISTSVQNSPPAIIAPTFERAPSGGGSTLLSIQSDLLGASSIGLKNILCLTGDPPKLGNYPDATAVFDVDAIGLTNLVRNLNHGLDIGANSIGASTGFTISVAANPGVPDIDFEVRRFALKVEAGAEFAITQPVFDMRLLEQFLRRIEPFRIPVIAGIWPLTSLRNAEFMKTDLRVSMPDEILARMAAATTPEAARAEGVTIAQEMLAVARPLVQGVQVSAPFGKYSLAAEVVGLA